VRQGLFVAPPNGMFTTNPTTQQSEGRKFP
jgi:hypothetical protein